MIISGKKSGRAKQKFSKIYLFHLKSARLHILVVDCGQQNSLIFCERNHKILKHLTKNGDCYGSSRRNILLY
jgi:hypothetical protein